MDSRMIKPKTLLLKDYLSDDFSSCSSNGFKSFPRRQCCTTSVRFLLEIDLKKNRQKKYLNFTQKNTPTIVKTKSKSALSAFQSVISAVKRFPFASSEKKKLNKSFLPRSFSKKLLERGLWKRKEIQRWKSFDELLKEEDLSKPALALALDCLDKPTKMADQCSSGNISCSSSKKTEVVKNGVGLSDSTTNSSSSDGSSSSTNSSTNSMLMQKEWSNEEKEQFSPVSVLDCPFHDEDEEISSSSPFKHRLARMEGTKKKLMKKIQRFECLANHDLEPVNLSKRFVLQPHDIEEEEEEYKQEEEEEYRQEEEEDEDEQKSFELLHQMKNTLPSYGLKLNAENLLLDFFREKIVERKMANSLKQWSIIIDDELIDEAEAWINGRKINQLLLGWEVQKNRQVYIKEMEKGKEWKTLEEENEEVALELEIEVFDTLLDQVLLEVMHEFTI